MKTPELGLSGLTRRVYIVTRTNKDGSAARKVDVTDQFEEIVKERRAMANETPTTPNGGMKTGIELIAEERDKQRSSWGDDHDDWHRHGEIAHAADCVLSTYLGRKLSDEGDDNTWMVDLGIKMQGRDGIKKLTVAGALIAAEIDRLQRKAAAEEKTT